MRIYPLELPEMSVPTADENVVPAVHDVVNMTAVDESSADTPRTFCVVYFRDARGPLWKVDVVADDAISAARSVVYRESLSADLVIGVIDLATIR
jgi:hypothetical protein